MYKQWSSSGVQIDMSTIASGVYLLKVQAEGKVTTKQIIKN